MARVGRKRLLTVCFAAAIVASGPLLAGVPAQAAAHKSPVAPKPAPPHVSGLPPVAPPGTANPTAPPKPLIDSDDFGLATWKSTTHDSKHIAPPCDASSRQGATPAFSATTPHGTTSIQLERSR